MPAGVGVIPAQLAIGPAQVEVEDGAVALEAAVGECLDGQRFILAADEAVAGEASAVELSGFVEAPVFLDAQGGVGNALVNCVPASGGA